MTRSSQERTLVRIFCIVLFLFTETLTSTAWGQKILTRKQPIQALVQTQTTALRSKVLKEGIPISSHTLTKFITQRFRQVGYHVVTDIQFPHYEEPNTSTPITGSPDEYVFQLSTPPCQFHYAYRGPLSTGSGSMALSITKASKFLNPLNDINPSNNLYIP